MRSSISLGNHARTSDESLPVRLVDHRTVDRSIVPTLLQSFRGCLWAACLLTAPLAAQESTTPEAHQGAVRFLQAYCQDCHSGDAAEADLRLEELTEPIDMLGQHESWNRMAELVRSSEMPPGDEQQPDPEEKQQFLQWLDQAWPPSIAGRQVSRVA